MTNPFRNYLTADKFPGQLRNAATVTLGSLLVPYPQYGAITQTNTDGRKMRTQTFEIRAQRPFAKGTSFLVSYAYNDEKRQEWFDDIAQYRVFTTGEGWEWRPTDLPQHRVTGAVTWQIPIGRERAFLSDLPLALDMVIGGWQHTAIRFYSAALFSATLHRGRQRSSRTRPGSLVRHGMFHDSTRGESALLPGPDRPMRVRMTLTRTHAHQLKPGSARFSLTR